MAWSEYNDGPLKELVKQEKEYDIVITHIRELVEIDKVKDMCEDVVTVFVEIDKELEEFTNSGDLDTKKEYNYDYVVYNVFGKQEIMKNYAKTLIERFEL